jgi:ketosteroid isomerase-like protein
MRFTGLLLALLCAAALPARAQDNADSASVRSKIIALEKAWNQAYKLGDTKGLDALLDNEMVLINDDGTVQSKAEFLSTIRATNSQEQQVAPESMHVHVYGNAAVATGVFRAKGTEAGKSYVRRERFVDTWIYKDGKWVCVASNATPVLR